MQLEIENLKSQQAAARKKTSLLQLESDFQNEAIDKLQEELRQARQKAFGNTTVGAMQLGQRDEGSNLVDFSMLVPALGLLGLAAVSLSLQAFVRSWRQVHEAAAPTERELTVIALPSCAIISTSSSRRCKAD